MFLTSRFNIAISLNNCFLELKLYTAVYAILTLGSVKAANLGIVLTGLNGNLPE